MTAAAKRTAAAALSGLVFAAGLALSGMTQPAKVLAFLDVCGDWDPSLALVMAGAIGVHFVAVRWARRRGRPLFDAKLHLATETRLDGRLVGGAALFGVGWGLSGYCPGPALVGAGSLGAGALTLAGGMLAGVALFDLVFARREREQPGPLPAPVPDAEG